MRKLIELDETRYQRWGCSECGWRFVPEQPVKGKSIEEMVKHYHLERDLAFAAHKCLYYPKP